MERQRINGEVSKKESLKGALDQLTFHLDKYREYESISKSAPKKPDRTRAERDMMTHADYIESILTGNKYVYDIINDGNPFQFENFWKYIESDVPKFIEKLKEEV